MKRADEVRYLTRVPRRPLENGRVLVHNQIEHTKYTRSGTRGFTFWSQKLTSDLKPCDCGWQDVPRYRVRFLRKGFA
jgi:hypothetical protein